jgi:hypothetical protein
MVKYITKLIKMLDNFLEFPIIQPLALAGTFRRAP